MIPALMLAATLHQPAQVLSQPRRTHHDYVVWIKVDVSETTTFVHLRRGTFQGAYNVRAFCKLIRPRQISDDPPPPDFYRCEMGVFVTPEVTPEDSPAWYEANVWDGEEFGEWTEEAHLFCDAGGGGTGCPCRLFRKTDPLAQCEYP